MKRRATHLRDVQAQNAMLSGLVLKMRTMNDWKRTGLRSAWVHHLIPLLGSLVHTASN